ncbi:ATP-dependent RNA helicase HrpA [Nocardioides sp. ChNu-153]|uniref:ATP-dependent RNA helicase HrpA n=1 Tax=unclassified Nocardioides TaxID=2615069 RepID=UPI0024060D50|nr:MULTISPECIES: ATP-dependent RNA helicase HrpA [unclassified Nocardioides]MDF9716282.1 ATP-dependent RNA helicase HrpA [Nocardioides sp. ChNu-99]MDN7122756.1 ATP-dependent RNA helicase HrpA [Nocardioides sp. ChNu-153]
MRIDYPPQLPVSARREDIAAAIRDHQVVIVAGETGSGKTTQLPKICLELGRGQASEHVGRDGRTRRRGGLIGHTQPRRIAARAVAERIAEETGTELGDLVGYQVRFTDKTSRSSRVKLMTDGILLAELQRDRDLRRYDTIIIDEAHERSLNIDFLLGYLRRLLPRRPDLKLIITSATIDPERFAAHFADRSGKPAPIIEVSGRTFPVEVRYRPLMETPEDDEDGEVIVRDQTEAVVDAVKELSAEGPGDVLVFLPGEREIRDTAEALGDLAKVQGPRGVDVLPLYSRLSSAEQHRVFSPSGSRRRVVLATNVAETSLTVPGIRYVVDSGVARISRYSARTKVQRLPIEPISQASAAQRSGRCGRVAEGIAIRLYSEEDFESRPEFTDPEILRTNLASVILQMTSLGLGDIARFPFVEPPDRRNVTAGTQLLEELGALAGVVPDEGAERPRGEAPRHRLTDVGRRLARLPIDPRLARMIIEAERLGCVREVVVIAAALSLQDPRERPAEQQAQADQAHARFKHESGDFLTWLNLWRHLKRQQRDLSGSAFRRMCKAEFLNYLRVREWQDFESQLRQVCKEMGVEIGTPAEEPDADGIHQALLSGLLSQIGLLEEREDGTRAKERQKGRRPGPREYLGARGTRFAIFPGSVLKGRNPPFVMAAELVETGRLWARQAAAIDPAWAERAGAHLVKRTYSEPSWSKKRGSAVANERVTLYGVPLVVDRTVQLGRVDAPLARELFLRHALVLGEWGAAETGRHRFLVENQRLLAEAEELEHRARRRDIVVDEETLLEFYDARVPASVVSAAHFDQWWKRERQKRPDLLVFDPSMLTHSSAEEIRAHDYPEQWSATGAGGGHLTFPISYHFEPGAADDGLTIDVPLASLNQLEPGDFSWNVPGLREELVTALIRSLPKNLRTALVPAPDHARRFLAETPPGEEPLLDALERYARSTTGAIIPREAWDWSKVAPHLRPTFRVVDETGGEVSRGKDLAGLAEPLRPSLEQAIADVAADAGQTVTGATAWVFGAIEPSFTQQRAGHEVRGFPTLDDEGASVALRVVGSKDEQEARHRLGVRRLLLLALEEAEPGLLKRVADGLSTTDKLGLVGSPYPSTAELLEDCRAAVVGEAVDARPAVRDQAAYDALLAAVRTDLEPRVRGVVADVGRALAAHRAVDKRLTGRADMHLLTSLTDLKAQLARLVGPGFVGEAGPAQLRRYPTYLRAMEERHERLVTGGTTALSRDRQLMAQIGDLQAAWAHQVAALPAGRPPGKALRTVRWLLEEYRVSLWAQQLGTAVPVSDARIRKALAG